MNKYPLTLIALLLTVLIVGVARADASESTETLVEFKGTRITLEDFRAAMARLPETDRAEYVKQPSRVVAMLENLLTNRVLAHQARDSGVLADPIAQRRIQLAEEAILASLRSEALRREIKAPDLGAAALDYYRANLEKYRIPEAVRATHVLIATQNRGEAEALSQAKEILARAKAGESLSELAVRYSDDPSAKANNGDLGHFGRGKMTPEFETAVFALQKEGDLVDSPVKTPFGFHVIQLTGRIPAKQRSFDEVGDQVKAFLQSEYISRRYAEILESLTSGPELKVNVKAVEALRTLKY